MGVYEQHNQYARQKYFIPMVRYTNHLANIFMNIDENYRKLKNNRKQINKVVSTKITH